MGFAAGAGIINCDLLYSQVERLPSEGEEVYSGGFDIQLGGGAPAIMVNLSRLHVPVHFQTFLGKDLFSVHIRGILDEMGMEYRNLYRGEGMPLNITSVAITPEDRTFLTYTGPVELTKREKEEIYRCSSGAKVVKMFMAGGDPEMADIYRQLKREGSILTMDTGWEDGLSLESYREFLELADYYTPNEREALKITGARSVPEAAEVLGRYFSDVIIKLGKRGCYYRNGNGEKILKPLSDVKAVDATGAGDAFMAGFMYGLYHDYCPEDCIRLGNVTGGYCVQAVGCLTRFPTEEELLKHLRNA